MAYVFFVSRRILNCIELIGIIGTAYTDLIL